MLMRCISFTIQNLSEECYYIIYFEKLTSQSQTITCNKDRMLKLSPPKVYIVVQYVI